eukprot:CAMPEP_0175131278 /NCGR_PEP_ID=MMETSP0087-20121206/6455_1 /TAXON_ID=136419 /ORGANISM="Unknown Unknown, Strain D1" /LENGTH=822 /DNA_ID=CAMNT_0016413553 /DNA_START=85 /DNA_END=2553 /DNA_ORIENTATION=-
MFTVYSDDKENVPQGERNTKVRKPLQTAKIDSVHDQYKRMIRQYKGDDPLSPWIEYVQCLQATYGENEENLHTELVPVLEQCTKLFQDYALYQNNKKYLRLWIIYADMCQNPEEIFGILTSKGIGSKLAMYYQAYALVLENQEQFTMADNLYMEGLAKQAEPFPSLIQTYQSFKERWQHHQQQLQQQQQEQQQRPASQAAKKQPQAGDTVGAYIPAAIVHPITGEEICFEEFRALTMSQRQQHEQFKQQLPVAVPFTVHSDDTAEPTQARSSLNVSATNHTMNANSPSANGLQSFLAGPSPSQDRAREEEEEEQTGEMAEPRMAGPSPTINTKAALRDVYDMFKDSPAFMTKSLTDEIGSSSPLVSDSPERRPLCSPVSFAVFTEDNFVTQEVPKVPVHTDTNDNPSNLDGEEDESRYPPVTPAVKDGEEKEEGENFLSPIMEGSDGDENSPNFKHAANQMLDPAAVRSSQLDALDITAFSGVQNYMAQDAPFDISAIVDESEADLELGEHLFHVEAIKLVTAGAEHVQLSVQDLDGDDSDANVSLKVFTGLEDEAKSVATPFWDFFISQKLRERVPAKDRSLFQISSQIHIFADLICLQAQRTDQGTLEDVLEAYWKAGETLSEVVVAFYAIEMIRVLETLQQARVIHGDIRPANLIIRNEQCDDWGEWSPDRAAGWAGKGVGLRSWSSAIDCYDVPTSSRFLSSDYPGGEKSTQKALTALTSKGWSYQLDKWQVAATLHLMMHGPSVSFGVSSSRQTTTAPPSGWDTSLWTSIMGTLLSNDNGVTALKAVRLEVEGFLQADVERKKSVKVLLCKQNLLVL